MIRHNYFLKRLGSTLPLLFLIPLLTFWLMNLVPGNYFDQYRMNPQISEETIQKYEELYHLDKPVLVQYVYWLRQLFQLDFGYSFAYKQPVLDVLGSRLGNTILLSGASFLWAWLLAIFLGLLASRNEKSTLNRMTGSLAYVALSIPSFLLCLLLLHLASRVGFFPLGGMRSVDHATLSWFQKMVDIGKHLLIPSFVLGLGIFAYLFRLMRSQAREVLGKEFVVYLRSWRLSENSIFYKHVGRNAMNPLVTMLGLELPSLVSGAALVEIFTGWPGLGQVMLQAVRTQDLFLVLGNLVMVSILLVLGNFLSDLLLVVVDPRIRMAKK